MNNAQKNINEGQGRAKTFAVIVNGRKKEVTTKELSFEQVVDLAYDNNPPAVPT